MERLRIQKSTRYLDTNYGSVVLDLGCGPGKGTEKLLGKKIVGVDSSKEMLIQAKERMKDNLHADFVLADAQKLPFADGYFDRILCSELLEHTQDSKKVLDEIYRVAAPEARVVFSLPNERPLHVTKKIILEETIGRFTLLNSISSPIFFFPAHHIFVFQTNK